jgi:hypothetical protein
MAAARHDQGKTDAAGKKPRRAAAEPAPVEPLTAGSGSPVG